MRRPVLLASVSAIACAMLVPGLAMAQEATALEDVIVTAQRREQALADVPVAATVLTAEVLADHGLYRFSDIADYTPGLFVQAKSPGDTVLVLRGVSSGDGSSYQEPRVSVFMDGAPLSKARGAVFDLFDVERVEVLRGPQTTLFGRSALTGAINVIQRKAGDEPGVDVTAEIASRDAGLFEVGVDAPIADGFGLRAAWRLRDAAGGPADLLGGGRFGESRTETAKLAFSFTAIPDLRSDLILIAERSEGSGQAFKSGTFAPSDPVTGATIGDLSRGSGAALAAGVTFEGGRGLGFDRELESLVWINEWSVSPDLSLTATTGVRRFENFEVSDFDGFALPLLTVGDDSRGRQWTQEVRANWTVGPLDLVLGGVFASERGSQRIPIQIDERLVLALLTGRLDRSRPELGATSGYVATPVQASLLRGIAASRGVVLSNAQSTAIAANLDPTHREQYADHGKSDGFDLYADARWRLAESWELLAGVRYGWLDKQTGLSSAVEGRSVLGGFLGAIGLPAAQRQPLLAALSAPGAGDIPFSAQFPVPEFGIRAQPTAGENVQWSGIDDEGAAWRLVLKHDLTPDVMTYASYARGRRPAVLSPDTPQRPGGPVVFTEVQAETIDAIEAGLKARTGGVLQTDLAVYHYRYQNFQTVIQQGAQYTVADAGEAEAWGAEAEARWQAADGLQLFASGEVSRARFKTGLYDGNHLANHPDLRLTAGALASVPVPGGELSIRPTWVWRGNHYFSDDNGKPELMTGALLAPLSYDARQDGYGLLHLDADYRPTGQNWSVGVFVRNALDQEYVVDAGNGGEDFGLPTYVAGERRTLGLRVRAGF